MFKSKKPKPKFLRYLLLVLDVSFWSDGWRYMPGAIKRFVKKEDEIAAANKVF